MGTPENSAIQRLSIIIITIIISVIPFDFIRTFSMFDGLVVLVILCLIKTLSLILVDSFILLDFGRSVMTVKTSSGV